ncbi:MAG: DUF1559 domain-containing protein [Pirellulaceae bacterium]
MNANTPGSIPPPNAPQQIPRQSSNTAAIIAIVCVVLLVGVVVCGGIAVAMLLPAVQAARESARRMQCTNNLKQISIALLEYEATYGSFPPAYTMDAAGNRLHSWRTLILPNLGQKTLYDQIDLEKPWNDPVNVPLSEMTISIYVCPSHPLPPGMTNYLAPIHPQGILANEIPTKIREITDGTTSTILIVEGDISQAVNWMDPTDIDGTLFPSTRGAHPGGTHAAMADGSVTFFQSNISSTLKDAMLTKDGNEDTSGM